MMFAFNKADIVHDVGTSICLIMIIINSKHKERTYIPHLINVFINYRSMDISLINLSLFVGPVTFMLPCLIFPSTACRC